MVSNGTKRLHRDKATRQGGGTTAGSHTVDLCHPLHVVARSMSQCTGAVGGDGDL